MGKNGFLALLLQSAKDKIRYNLVTNDFFQEALIKTDILKTLSSTSDNQAFEFELVSKLCKRGYKIGEVPVYYKPRTAKEGKKVKGWDMISAIILIIRVKLYNCKSHHKDSKAQSSQSF